MKSPSENDENAEKYIKPNRKWEKKKNIAALESYQLKE